MWSERDVIFAPWRVSYVRELARRGLKCFICHYISQDEAEDVRNLVIYRSKLSVALFNRYPYTRAHTLIAPKRHVPSVADLTEEEIEDCMRVLKAVVLSVQEVLIPDELNVGINIGRAAGAGLEEHVHIHVIPRWRESRYEVPVTEVSDVVYEDLRSLTTVLRERVVRNLRTTL